MAVCAYRRNYVWSINTLTVIRRKCGQTLARVRVSQTKIVSNIISLQQIEST